VCTPDHGHNSFALFDSDLTSDIFQLESYNLNNQGLLVYWSTSVQARAALQVRMRMPRSIPGQPSGSTVTFVPPLPVLQHLISRTSSQNRIQVQQIHKACWYIGNTLEECITLVKNTYLGVPRSIRGRASMCEIFILWVYKDDGRITTIKYLIHWNTLTPHALFIFTHLGRSFSR
jgi:hypothetical protein